MVALKCMVRGKILAHIVIMPFIITGLNGQVL